jgi:hypothetical protein
MPRAPFTDELRFARMSGSSIAAPNAAGWVVDFLNAAYFARPPGRRGIDDLRLAFAVLTTRWYQQGPTGRLGVRDLPAFHRAFGVRRLRTWPVGTLDRDGLLEGAAALLGDWFPDAYADPARRAHGVVFPTADERARFDPGVRRGNAALGPVTPPEAPPDGQRWSTYPPVPLADGERALALLLAPERWPDFAAEGGRFTALRMGGLEGQTFEIEVAAGQGVRTPVYQRGYVTATRVLHAGDPALGPFLAELEEGAGQPPVPAGGTPLIGIELTTHEGHFLGRARSRLVAWRDAGGEAWVRDVGSWDPLPWYLAASYATLGRAAQHAFWGPDAPDESMLAQLGIVSGSA